MHTPKLPVAMAKNLGRALLWTLVMASVAVAQRVGFPPSNCARDCGGIEVPYPFGLDNEDNDTAGGRGICRSDNSGFRLKCNYSYSPPKLFAGKNEVTGINISTARMGLLQRISYVCFNNASGLPYDASSRGINFGASRRLSSTENEFIAVGCETLAQFMMGNRTFGGCMSGCSSLEMAVEDEGECSGFGCCRTPIPKDINWYSTNYYYRQNESMVYKFNPCSYFFIAEKGNYTFHKLDLKSMDKKRMFPVVLDWAMGREDNLTCEEARKNESSYACVAANSECLDSVNGPGYVCNCSPGYAGNPYLHDGCQDIDECTLDRKLYPCKGICINTNGDYNCICPKGKSSADPYKQPCYKTGQLSSGAKVGIGVGVALGAVSILLTPCTLLYKKSKRRRARILRVKCFHKNQELLKQVVTSLGGDVMRVRTFPLIEIEKATNKFDVTRVLGRGGFGIVYKGLLMDNTVVAIKRSTKLETEQLEVEIQQFINEVAILSQIDHRNVVKLIGCCLETKVPLLVYEFISNGTLSHHLLKTTRSSSLLWDDRLRIALEIASAISYLHSAASRSIFHRDLKTSNVLMDEKLTAKVSDFGTSKSIMTDQTQVSTIVCGTQGYLDPEYMQTGLLTEKSDVYSWGVILLELLTGEKGERGDLYSKFMSAFKENRVEEIIESQIIEGIGNENLKVLVDLAERCLRHKGEERPNMREVEMVLLNLRNQRTC